MTKLIDNRFIDCEKFGATINQTHLNKNIFQTKKHKQRYLDYAYKIAVKRKFEYMISIGQIKPLEIENIYFFVDEHTTAPDGLYELRESMLQEFKEGMFTSNFQTFKEPIFPNLKNLNVKFCNSSKSPLIRAEDIVSNRLYYLTINADLENLDKNIIPEVVKNFIIYYKTERLQEKIQELVPLEFRRQTLASFSF